MDENKTSKILVVDDEPQIRDLLKSTLENVGYSVEVKSNGLEAYEYITNTDDNISLVLLDIMMPRLSGTGLLERLKLQDIDIPVIFLTAKDNPEDIIDGLQLGADDYITKPFNIEITLEKINAYMRRVSKDKSSIIVIDKLRINPDSHEVTVNDKVIDLTNSQYKVLYFLASNRNKIFSKESIYNFIKDSEWGDIKAVERHISSIRKKLETNNCFAVETARGLGYIIR